MRIPLAVSSWFGANARLMVKDDPHLVLRIDTKLPIEIGDFVSLFVGLGNQYEKFVAAEQPGTRGATRFYVREIRAGSIIAELVGYTIGGGALGGGVLTGIKHANDVAKFVETFGGKLKRYFRPGGRDEGASKGDVADYLRAVGGMAADPNATLELAAYRNGEVEVAFDFRTSEARVAEANLLAHQSELELKQHVDHERVLMQFTRTDVSHAQAGKRSGERVLISGIHAKPLPIVFASNLAEERVRHEIAEADENVYKKAFDVDVNVESIGGRPVAYRIVAVHQVIDAPEAVESDAGLPERGTLASMPLAKSMAPRPRRLSPPDEA